MILRIALDTPLRTLFDYRAPADAPSSQWLPGCRFWVPFGRRKALGILVEVQETSELPADRLRTAVGVIDDEPAIDAHLLRLLTWAAEYYHHPIGEVIFAALPPALRAGAQLHQERQFWSAVPTAAIDGLPKRAHKLRRVLSDLTALATPPPWDAADLRALRELESRGFVTRQRVRADASISPALPSEVAMPELNAEQAHAVAQIRDQLQQFDTWLLKGVTGSGKTEVYLRLIAEVLHAGDQALVLVPEIGLTPQLLERFRERFGRSVVVMHSNLNDSERLAAWRAARSGEARVVIGTRSAVFCALARPGLIVVDEEHDPSFKQQEGFRYSGRDLAIVRAQYENIPIVLGSATPSLESISRARRKPARLLTLPHRAGAAAAPAVTLIDLRRYAAHQGLSAPALQSIQMHLSQDAQVMLFLNRRGYAPVLFCPACGWAASCLRCEARLTVHRRERHLTCHHCAATQPLLELCPSCAAPTKPVGQGTERIEETLAQLFPNVPVGRIDRDSTRRKGELESVLDRIHRGEVKLLVGTQMIAKGHHFPNVTLVVILNADQGLFSTDFRASERLAQTIVQVAGRAGREHRPGEVLIQTEYPQHPLLQRLLEGGYDAFADAALLEREQAGWPPYSRVALIRADAARPDLPMGFLQRAREEALSILPSAVKTLGPAPAPMEKRIGRYRAQLLLHAPTHGPLQRGLSALVPQLADIEGAKRVRWSVDVDPMELF